MNSSERVEKDPVPAAIVGAARWRAAGERLFRASPELFERMFLMLAASCVADEDPITESYYLT